MNKQILFILIIILIPVTYGIYRSESVLKGPQIEIHEINIDGQNVSIEGNIQGANYITINDNRIFTDELGDFTIENIYPYGFSIIEIYVKNKQNIDRTLEIPIQVE